MMELIIISQSKLKIMLSPPDMQHYELQADNLSCATEQTRRAFRHIFDDARSQVGFETEGERLFVQLYASRDGGCEIFVTKMGETQPLSLDVRETNDPGDHTPPLTPAEQELLRRVLASDIDTNASTQAFNECMNTQSNFATLTPSVTQTVVLSLSELSPLLAVCRRLLALAYTGKSLVYIEEDASPVMYHLLLDVPDGGFYLLPDMYAFLKEYGHVGEAGHTQLYLSEHGRLLCGENAVSVLGAL